VQFVAGVTLYRLFDLNFNWIIGPVWPMRTLVTFSSQSKVLFMTEHTQSEENPRSFPLIPTKLEETGLNIKFISALLIKSMYVLGLETNVDVAKRLKLYQGIVDDLLGRLKQQGLMENRSVGQTDSRITRYSLTGSAKEMAFEAMRQCEYVGPAPVPLTQYQSQVDKQRLANEKISLSDLTICLSHLVLPTSIIRKLGPAVNSGKSILIYGPPGNGKTSISEAIGNIYRQSIYIPHCIEVDGQIIRIFDPTVHEEILTKEKDGQDYKNLLKKRPDPRWVRCRRPVIITGGELTLEMLDLDYDETSRFYEAPPQMKAIGGVFVIDDFGRQLVQPRDLINRWIVPLEKQIDYLTIHTGKKFDIPFDELVIFSTNISPDEIMDPGQLRRVKYKMRIEPPSVPEYVTIFKQVCKRSNIYLPDDVLSFLLEDFYPREGMSMAGFHPGFFVEHAIAACRYRGGVPIITVDLVKDALENLYISNPEKESTAEIAHSLNFAKSS
jgi:DNA-binding MarR family transcriptional regulator